MPVIQSAWMRMTDHYGVRSVYVDTYLVSTVWYLLKMAPVDTELGLAPPSSVVETRIVVTER